jgi:hypothetical protein
MLHLLVQNDMDALEQIQGMPPGMYHRYGVLDDMDDDEDEPSREDMGDGFGSSGAYNADMLVAGMAGLGMSDAAEGGEQPGGAEEGAAGNGDGGAGRGIGNWSLLAHPGGFLQQMPVADCGGLLVWGGAVHAVQAMPQFGVQRCYAAGPAANSQLLVFLCFLCCAVRDASKHASVQLPLLSHFSSCCSFCPSICKVNMYLHCAVLTCLVPHLSCTCSLHGVNTILHACVVLLMLLYLQGPALQLLTFQASAPWRMMLCCWQMTKKWAPLQPAHCRAARLWMALGRAMQQRQHHRLLMTW